MLSLFKRRKARPKPSKYRLVELTYPKSNPNYARFSVERHWADIGWTNECYCETQEQGETELEVRRNKEIIHKKVIG